MMIHEKIMAGQFLLDIKNERSGILPAKALAHQSKSIHHFPPLSPPLSTLDIYSAYAYQQQLQQQLLNSHLAKPNHVTTQQPICAEVLDLSRRDLVDLQRKTPSPYPTSSSLGSASPVSSSPKSIKQEISKKMTTDLLFPAQANQPINMAALYPNSIYYPTAVKQMCVSSSPQELVSQPAPIISKTNISQTFATTDLESLSPQSAFHSNTDTTPTSSTNNLSSLDARNTRPFKAFPRDPLVIAANFAATDVLHDNPRGERYTEYRKRVLEQIRSNNGGSRTVTNPKMRRTNSVSGSVNEGSSSNNSENDDRHQEEFSDCDSNSGHDPQTTTDCKANESSLNSSNYSSSYSGAVVKDAAYYERRRKNNAAAKKSRDRRRIKEDEIAIRAAYLERQNIELLCQIDALKAQLAALTSKMT